MLGSMILAAVLSGGCPQPVQAQTYYTPAVAAIPVYLSWRVDEASYQQKQIDKLTELQAQNTALIAALASGVSPAESDAMAGAQQVRTLIDQRCVSCHNAQRKDGDVDLSGAISTELRLKCVKEIVGQRMPKRGQKFSPEETELTFDWAHEE